MMKISVGKTFMFLLLIIFVLSGCRKKKDPREIHAIRLHSDSVTSVSFSSDGNLLASSSLDQTIRVLNVEDYQFIQGLESYGTTMPPEVYTVSPIFGGGKGFTDVAFSPDNTTLAVAQTYEISGSTIESYEIINGTRTNSFELGGGNVNSMVFHSDGRRLAVAEGVEGQFGRSFILDTQDSNITSLSLNVWGGVNDLAFSPDQETVCGVGLYNDIRISNAVDGEEVGLLLNPYHHAAAVAYTPDGHYILSGGDDEINVVSDKTGVVHLWNVQTRTVEKTSRVSRLPVRTIAVAPSGRVFAAAGEDLLIHIIEIDTLTEVARMRGHLAPINKLVFSPNGELLASGSDDAYVRLWYVGDITSGFDSDSLLETESDGGTGTVDTDDTSTNTDDDGGPSDTQSDTSILRSTDTVSASGMDGGVATEDGVGTETFLADGGMDGSVDEPDGSIETDTLIGTDTGLFGDDGIDQDASGSEMDGSV